MPGVVAHAHQTPQSISGIGSAVGIHARTRGPQFQPFDGTSGGRRSVSHAHVRQGLTQQGTVTPVLSVGGVSQSWLYGGAPRQSQFLSHHAAHMHGAHNNEWELLNGKLERSGTGNDPEHRDQQRSATPILGILPYYGWGYGPLSLGHDTWGYAPGWHPPAGNQSAYVMHDSSDRLAHPYGGAGPEEVYAARAYVGQPAPLAKNLSQFVVRGQDDFRRENFASAVAYWRQAMRDDPGNGTLALLLAQALFATGRFSDAGARYDRACLCSHRSSGASSSATVTSFIRRSAYTPNTCALEKAATENADSSALRLLLGYHYGYLGFTRHAAAQLQRAERLAPNDELTKKLLNHFRVKAENEKAAEKAAPQALTKVKSATPFALARQLAVKTTD